MIRRAPLAPIALGAMLAGCATAPPRPAPPGRYAGTYVGTTTLTGFSTPDWRCDWQAAPITVVGNSFHADLDGAPMTVTISADGSFDAYGSRNIYSQTKYMQVVHITGRIAGDTLAATVHQSRCTFHLQLERQ